MDQDHSNRDAEEIAAAMKEQRWSAAELSRKSGVSENTIGRVLKGQTAQAKTIRRLREELGLQPRTIAQESSLSEIYPPNIVAVQLMIGALMSQIPESEWESVGIEVAATLFAHQRRVSGTGE